MHVYIANLVILFLCSYKLYCNCGSANQWLGHPKEVSYLIVLATSVYIPKCMYVV